MQLFARAPAMLALLREALAAWSEQFDATEDATDAEQYGAGTDLLEWFSDWRSRVRNHLASPSGTA